MSNPSRHSLEAPVQILLEAYGIVFLQWTHYARVYDERRKSPKSEPALELICRAVPSVEAHHRSVGPNAGRNSGGRRIIIFFCKNRENNEYFSNSGRQSKDSLE